MSAAEFRRRAELCRSAAEKCACVMMRHSWIHKANVLETQALRAERWADRWTGVTA